MTDRWKELREALEKFQKVIPGSNFSAIARVSVPDLLAENDRLREALRQIEQFGGQIGISDISTNGNLATAVGIAREALKEPKP